MADFNSMNPTRSGGSTGSPGKSGKAPVNPAGKTRGWAKVKKASTPSMGDMNPTKTVSKAAPPSMNDMNPTKGTAPTGIVPSKIRPVVGVSGPKPATPVIKGKPVIGGPVRVKPGPVGGPTPAKPRPVGGVKKKGNSGTAHSPVNPAGKTRGWAKKKGGPVTRTTVSKAYTSSSSVKAKKSMPKIQPATGTHRASGTGGGRILSR